MTGEMDLRDRTARVRLARVAERVLALTAGVMPNGGSGRWYTPDGPDRIAGVIAAWSAGPSMKASVELELYLTLLWPPPPLDGVTAGIRSDIRSEAEREGLDDVLGEVDIHVADIVESAGGGD